MKPKKFELDKGKFVVVASYTDHNETTGEDDEHTMRTYERPRPVLKDAIQTLALNVREHYNLMELKLRLATIEFKETKTGHVAKFWLESVDTLRAVRVGPLAFKREPETMPSSTELVPDSTQNTLLAQVERVENKISEYLLGDREQAVLPPVKAEEQKGQKGLPFKILKRIRRQKAGA